MNCIFTSLCFTLLCFSGVRSEYSHLEWNDCGSDPAVQIHDLGVSPMPVMVPGTMNFTLQVTNTLPRLDRMILSLSIKRQLSSWFELPLPCMFNIGSCDYDDTCTLLDTMQRENWAGVMGQMGGQIQDMLASAGMTQFCATTLPNINIRNYPIRMPPLPAILAFFAQGDYKTRLRAIDYATNRVLVCVDLRMTMKVKERQRESCGLICRMRARSGK